MRSHRLQTTREETMSTEQEEAHKAMIAAIDVFEDGRRRLANCPQDLMTLNYSEWVAVQVPAVLSMLRTTLRKQGVEVD